MLLRTLAVISAVWLLPSDTPRLHDDDGDFIPLLGRRRRRATQPRRLSEPDGGQTYIYYGENVYADRIDWLDEELVVDLVFLLLCNPLGFRLLAALADSLARVGDVLSRRRIRSRTGDSVLHDARPISHADDDPATPKPHAKSIEIREIHNDSKPDTSIEPNLHHNSEPEPPPRPHTPTQHELSAVPTTPSRLQILDEHSARPAVAPRRTAKQTLRHYLAKLIAPLVEPTPSPLLRAGEAARSIEGVVPYTLNTVGGPSTEELARVLGGGDEKLVDLERWTVGRSPTKKVVNGGGEDVDVDVVLEGLLDRGLTPDRETPPRKALADISTRELDNGTPTPRSANTPVKPPVSLPPLLETPAAAREMLDLHSPFSDDGTDYASTTPPKTSLDSSTVSLSESHSPFLVVGPNGSVVLPKSGSSSGSGLGSGSGGFSFVDVRASGLRGRETSPTPMSSKRPAEEQLLPPLPHSVPHQQQQQQRPIITLPARSLVQSRGGAPAPAGQRPISGRRRFGGAPPDLAGIKQASTMVVPVSNDASVPDGRAEREGDSKRRFVQPVKVQAVEFDSDSDSDEEDEDEEEEGEVVKKTSGGTTTNGNGNGLAKGEQMVWFANANNQQQRRSESPSPSPHPGLGSQVLGGRSPSQSLSSSSFFPAFTPTLQSGTSINFGAGPSGAAPQFGQFGQFGSTTSFHTAPQVAFSQMQTRSPPPQPAFSQMQTRSPPPQQPFTAHMFVVPPVPPVPAPTEAYDDDFESDSGDEEDEEEEEEEEEDDVDDEGLPYDQDEEDEEVEERHGIGFISGREDLEDVDLDGGEGEHSRLSVRNWSSEQEEEEAEDDEDEDEKTVKLNGRINGDVNGNDDVHVQLTDAEVLEDEVQRFADAKDDATAQEEAHAQFAAAAGIKPVNGRGWRTPGAEVPDIVVSLAPEELSSSSSSGPYSSHNESYFRSTQEWDSLRGQDWTKVQPEGSREDDDDEAFFGERAEDVARRSRHSREAASVHEDPENGFGEGHVLDAVLEEDEPTSSPETLTHPATATVDQPPPPSPPATAQDELDVEASESPEIVNLELVDHEPTATATATAGVGDGVPDETAGVVVTEESPAVAAEPAGGTPADETSSDVVLEQVDEDAPANEGSLEESAVVLEQVDAVPDVVEDVPVDESPLEESAMDEHAATDSLPAPDSAGEQLAPAPAAEAEHDNVPEESVPAQEPPAGDVASAEEANVEESLVLVPVPVADEVASEDAPAQSAADDTALPSAEPPLEDEVSGPQEPLTESGDSVPVEDAAPQEAAAEPTSVEVGDSDAIVESSVEAAQLEDADTSSEAILGPAPDTTTEDTLDHEAESGVALQESVSEPMTDSAVLVSVPDLQDTPVSAAQSEDPTAKEETPADESSQHQAEP